MEKDKLSQEDQKVYTAIATNHDNTQGRCGILHVGVMKVTGMDFETAKASIIKLYQFKLIIVRKGINGKLYFCNGKKERPVF